MSSFNLLFCLKARSSSGLQPGPICIKVLSLDLFKARGQILSSGGVEYLIGCSILSGIACIRQPPSGKKVFVGVAGVRDRGWETQSTFYRYDIHVLQRSLQDAAGP